MARLKGESLLGSARWLRRHVEAILPYVPKVVTARVLAGDGSEAAAGTGSTRLPPAEAGGAYRSWCCGQPETRASTALKARVASRR